MTLAACAGNSVKSSSEVPSISENVETADNSLVVEGVACRSRAISELYGPSNRRFTTPVSDIALVSEHFNSAQVY